MYQNQNLEDRIIEVEIEEIIGMKITREAGVSLEKGSTKVIQEEIIEVVAVDLGQDQE